MTKDSNKECSHECCDAELIKALMPAIIEEERHRRRMKALSKLNPFRWL